MNYCSIEGCNKGPVVAHGWCRMHYGRWYRYGDVNVMVQEHTINERDTPEYRAWKAMKSRCYNKKLPYYHHYGGRGISVCEEWRHSYFAFLRYVGRKPSPKHSLDRINNDGNYEPGNVRWATQTQQVINQGIKTTNRSGIKGVWRQKNSWGAFISIDKKVRMIGWYRTIEEAAQARKEAEEKYYD